MNAEDRDSLIQFLQELRDLLHTLIEQREQFFPERLRPLLAAAWPDVEQIIVDLILMLQRGDVPPEMTQRLTAAGLTGAQLQLKLGALQLALDDLFDMLQDLDLNLATVELRRLEEKVLRRLLKLLQRVMRYLNILLGSFTQALPVSEPVKEFKELVEAGLEDLLDKYPEQE